MWLLVQKLYLLNIICDFGGVLTLKKYDLVPSRVPGQLSRYCAEDPLPGVVAGSCNPATRRQVLEDGLRRGLLVVTGSC